MKRLTDHVAVVTGAGSGIGKALALALAGQGVTVAAVGRRAAALEEVAALAAAAGGKGRAYAADLACEDEIRALVTMLHRDCERIDILVHNAAAMRMGRIADAPVEDLDLQYRTNVRAPYLLTQGLLPMLRQRRGQIVFMNSSAGLTAGAGVGPYAATKHALKALADSLREEVNRDGVRVVSVFPGRTATPLQEQVHAWERRPYRPERLLQAEDIAATVVNALCLPPTAEVTDIKIRSMTKPE